METRLKEELAALARDILKEMEHGDFAFAKAKEKTLAIYEKLTVLQLLERGNPGKIEKLPEIVPQSVKVENKTVSEIALENDALFQKVRSRNTGNDNSEGATATESHKFKPLYEPVMETIKDMVAQMPPEADEIDAVFEAIAPSKKMKNDKGDIGEYGVLPTFVDPKTQKTAKEGTKPKSLNDRLKKGLDVGLNDRIAFIKNLFAGNTADYNRVLSQIATMDTYPKAEDFIKNRVKPDYDWEGKEVYEERFLQIIEKKFD